MDAPSDTPQPPPSLRRRISGNFGIRIAGLGLQFVGSILIARLLGVEAFGVYTYAFTCVIITGILMSLGMQQLSVREVPRFMANNQTGLLWGFLTLQFGLIFGFTGLVAGGLFWLEGTGQLALPIAAGWLVAGVLLHALILNVSSLLAGFQRVLQSQLMETLLRQCLFLAALCVAVYIGVELGAAEVFGLSVLVGAVVLSGMIILAWRAVPPAPGHTEMTPKLWLTASLPLLVMVFANQMQTNLDILMLGVLSDAADVGRYRVASRAADLMLITNNAAIQVLGPMLAKTLAQRNSARALQNGQHLITQSAQLAALMGGGVCLALLLGAEFYMSLFGPDFLGGTPALRVLVVAQMLGILCGPVAVILVTLGREKLVLWAALAAVVVNLSLNIVLIPAFGLMGAATATFIAVLFFQGILLACVLQASPFDPTLWLRRRR